MNKYGNLSQREKEILNLLHFPNPIIAKKLCISISTVKTYIHILLEAFQQRTRTGLMLYALKNNIVDIRKVDCGFWDEYGNYQEDIELVDFSKE